MFQSKTSRTPTTSTSTVYYYMNRYIIISQSVNQSEGNSNDIEGAPQLFLVSFACAGLVCVVAYVVACALSFYLFQYLFFHTLCACMCVCAGSVCLSVHDDGWW